MLYLLLGVLIEFVLALVQIAVTILVALYPEKVRAWIEPRFRQPKTVDLVGVGATGSLSIGTLSIIVN
jgi:hypothetical protein